MLNDQFLFSLSVSNIDEYFIPYSSIHSRRYQLNIETSDELDVFKRSEKKLFYFHEIE